MKRAFAAVFSLSVILASSASLDAKGPTTRITIAGATLQKPITIRDTAVLKKFQIWAGPGVTMTHGGVTIEETEGFIVDWSSGIAATHPGGLPRFEVTFYVGDSSARDYVVSYEIDPESGQGYVYLPGPADELYELNKKAMLHGHDYEGHWLLASNEWQHDVIEPLMMQSAR